MILRIDFLTEYMGEDYKYPVTDLKKVAVRYIK